MNKDFLKSFFSLMIPIILLISAYVFFLRINTLSPLLIAITPYLPYLFFIAVILLAYSFNKSNIFFLAIIFVIMQLSLEPAIYTKFNYTLKLNLIYSIIGILLPLNVLLYTFLKERGIFSLWGIIKFLFIVGQFFLTVWIVFSENPAILKFLNIELIFFNFTCLNGISQVSILVFLLAVTVLFIKLLMKNSFLNTTSIGLLFATAFITCLRNYDLSTPIFVAIAGVILIIFILQSSYSMAYLDELTEIPGRRALREEMMKLSGIYVIAMTDIDFFKKFNDKYGHDVGDDVLRLVATKLKHVTGGGKAFRYGGEEFVIIFPGKKLEDILPHLDKLRETIARAEFTLRGKDRPPKKPEKIKPSKVPAKKLSVTVSIGAAEKSRELKKTEDVLKAADKALYRAKNNGRNRVSK